MKAAVLSDIHGNGAALERCLADAVDRGAERFIFLGDYAGELPEPERVMDRLYRLRERFPCHFIRGNKEDYWLNPGDTWREGDSTTGMLWYNMQHLRREDLDFYRSLPHTEALRLPGLPPITLCHGTPESARVKMLPDDAATHAIMARDPSPLILSGHTHEQAVIRYGGKIALNPGSVGVPLDSGGQTEYMLLTGDADGWHWQMIALPYDVEGVIAEMRRAGLYRVAPAWSRVTACVLRGSAFSHADALTRTMEICRERTGRCDWPHIPEACWEQALKELQK